MKVDLFVGSGKSTLSYAIKDVFPNFIHLSIDKIISSRHGLYNIDYSPDLYKRYQVEADTIFEEQYLNGLTNHQSMILDRSFYSKKDRDTYRNMAEHYGTRVVLVYFRPHSKEGSWQRIRDRQAERGGLSEEEQGDAAYDISREVFEQYWEGFEIPTGEGEVEIEV